MSEGGGQTTQPMQPNFVLMKLPDETGMEFVEILPFTPANRNNLIGWIAGRSDGAHYGTVGGLQLPQEQAGGWTTADRGAHRSERAAFRTIDAMESAGLARAARARLLVIPTGRALLYAEPIYLQAERSPMPELRLVVLALQDRLAYGSTFEAALAALFGGAGSSLTAAAEPQRARRRHRTAASGANRHGSQPDHCGSRQRPSPTTSASRRKASWARRGRSWKS